jgi:hypothetical protein
MSKSIRKPYWDYNLNQRVDPKDTIPCIMLEEYEIEKSKETPFYDLVSEAMKNKYLQKMDPRDIVNAVITRNAKVSTAQVG